MRFAPAAVVLFGTALVVSLVLADDEPGAAKEPETKQVTIKITDTSANQFVAMGFAAAAQFNNESTDGYEKGYVQDGVPIHENYHNEGKSGSLTALVGGRFTVETGVSGLPPEEMQAWLKRVDVKGLAQAKPDGNASVVHFKKLLAFLPEPPSGWSAEKPTGSTNEAMGFKSSEVQRVYEKK